MLPSVVKVLDVTPIMEFQWQKTKQLLQKRCKKKIAIYCKQ